MSAAAPGPAASRDDGNIFSVSASMSFFSWLICEHPRAWTRIGRFETRLLEDALEGVRVQNPIWVTGLARSGSTLLLEILAKVPGVTSQSYKDFPPVFTPYAWNRLLEHMRSGPAQPAERAHRDGIMVTLDSPEAMEEPLWMSFFPAAHDPARSNIIEPGSNPEFVAFLREHIRKLLAVRAGSRYLAKANYQVTRLEFLLDAFPDARFVIPVRDPVTHIASLMKTHALFVRGQRANARARSHLRRVGHYEFGLDRVPINTGNPEVTRDIQRLWDNGEEVRGWANYWSELYNYVGDRITANPRLAEAAHVVDYQRLCQEPQQQLEAVFRHCNLAVKPEFTHEMAAGIAAPTYYQPEFSDADIALIETETAATAKRLRHLSA